MPLFMHQWVYKDAQVRRMVTTPEDRANVVRIAVEAFGGTLRDFFFTLGQFDGMCIAEFEDNDSALACLMSLVGQGRIRNLCTTVLFTNDSAQAAMEQAHTVVVRNPRR